jgi:hypothetical protein
MRVLVILALALLLAGCNGDRMKQGMNVRQHSHKALDCSPKPYAAIRCAG